MQQSSILPYFQTGAKLHSFVNLARLQRGCSTFVESSAIQLIVAVRSAYQNLFELQILNTRWDRSARRGSW